MPWWSVRAGVQRACCVIFSLDRTSCAAVIIRADAICEVLAMRTAFVHEIQQRRVAMSRTSTRLPAIIVVFTVALAGAASAQTDPTKCHKEVVKNLAKYKKTYLKAVSKCLDGKNEGKLPPNTSCPDAAANLKISKVALQAPQKVAAKCSLSDLTTTLGFRNDCQYETATTGVEGATCSPMTVASAADVASCLLCWKGAELAEFIAILYASHASEVCGGALDETSPV